MARLVQWNDADTIARKIKMDGMPGYLATIGSMEENYFLYTELLDGVINTTFTDQYFIGGKLDDTAWIWITHEPFLFTNWAMNQPSSAIWMPRIAFLGTTWSQDPWTPSQWRAWPGNYGEMWSIVEWGGLEDLDGDSIPDVWDNCPGTYNPLQTDSDGDGIGDLCDGTPVDVNPGAGDALLPGGTVLSQNYPNPFNPQTTIAFSLTKSQPVRLSVFNPLGQLVIRLVDGDLPPGEHSVVFEGGGYASGVYFCRLEAGPDVRTRKMVLSQ
jgi:hypothetical protein